jgi:putative membrane protein
MIIAAYTVSAIVALLHIYFMILEMFFWDKPLGLRAFDQTKDQARSSRILAANQGLYNGFLAAGLIWGLILGSNGINIILFFLSCVLVAGIFGAATASRKILYIQAIPAAAGLILVLLSV